jgi:hypothetical protein
LVPSLVVIDIVIEAAGFLSSPPFTITNSISTLSNSLFHERNGLNSRRGQPASKAHPEKCAKIATGLRKMQIQKGQLLWCFTPDGAFDLSRSNAMRTARLAKIVPGLAMYVLVFSSRCAGRTNMSNIGR